MGIRKNFTVTMKYRGAGQFYGGRSADLTKNAEVTLKLTVAITFERSNSSHNWHRIHKTPCPPLTETRDGGEFRKLGSNLTHHTTRTVYSAFFRFRCPSAKSSIILTRTRYQIALERELKPLSGVNPPAVARLGCRAIKAHNRL